MTNYKTIIPLILLITTALFSQSDNKPEETVKIDFRLFLWPYEDWSLASEKEDRKGMPLVFWKKDSNYVPIEVSVGDTSQWGEYVGSPDFFIYKKVFRPNLDKHVMVPFAKAKIPFNSEKVIMFVFTKNTTEKGLKQSIIINASEKEIALGEAQILNLSKRNLQLMTKNGLQVIGGMNAKRLIATDFPGMRIPIYALAEDEEGNFNRVFSSLYPMNKRSRMLLVLFESTASAGNWKLIPVSLR
jgi:hypothetical protein|tara:strand:- start:190 stop:918 length:729 start_codon:yes stop_codon:yes gene_type:complete